MTGKIKYTFSGQVWKSSGTSGWHFLSLPQELSQEIRENLKWQEEGWGRMNAWAQIGNSQWETAIWYDKKHQTYLLPIKGNIRKKERVKEGDVVETFVWL